MQELRFHIELTTNDPGSLAKSLTGLKISTSTSGKPGSEVGVQIGHVKPSKEVKTGWNTRRPALGEGSRASTDNSWRLPSLLGPVPTVPPPITTGSLRNVGTSPFDAVAMRHGWPVENFTAMNHNHQSSGALNQGRNDLSGNNNCVRISNIPQHLTPGDVATVFSRFGKCMNNSFLLHQDFLRFFGYFRSLCCEGVWIRHYVSVGYSPVRA